MDIFQKSLYKSGDNLRGEMVLSFYDRKEVKEVKFRSKMNSQQHSSLFFFLYSISASSFAMSRYTSSDGISSSFLSTSKMEA